MAETTNTTRLPESLVASLDIEELERRLALSDMEIDLGMASETEVSEYAASSGWEVSGSGSTADGGTATVTAKKSW